MWLPRYEPFNRGYHENIMYLYPKWIQMNVVS